MDGRLDIYEKSLKQHSHRLNGKSNFDLSNETIYTQHANLIKKLGDNYLRKEGKEFVIDDNNRDLLRFLLYYFNDCELALNVFPERKYSLKKNVLLCGSPGTGKTILMQVFSDYLKIVKGGHFFENISLTQLMSHYKIHNNIDKFTFNEVNSKSFEGNPYSLCLHDFGLDTENQKHYGTEIKSIIDEFLYARYDIFQLHNVMCHLTTNLSKDDLVSRYDERLVDRFKAYNIIPLLGSSRR